MSNYYILKNKILFGKYKVGKIIGKGSFGCVFQGINIKDKSKVAIKIESKNSKSHLLEIECNFLSILKGYGIPEIKSFGYHGNFYIMVQELLGYNLAQIKYIIKKFTIKDIAMMGIQIIDRIEYVHSKNFIHRDIKPENFVVGYQNNSTIYIIDFGISRKYRNARKHLKFQLLGKMFGTVRYASYNASRGVEQSRRDDLESIGYMLIYLTTGHLPWQGLSLKDQNKAKKYLEMLLLKKYSPIEVICKNVPSEFIDYVKYCRELTFEQDPDYEYLRNLFRGILLRNQEINDKKFSWFTNKNFKNNNLNDNKYINFLRRKESPHTRLFRAIQQSLEKSEKKEKKINEKNEEIPEKKNIIINIQNIHSRGTSDDMTQSSKNDILDNSNDNKNELSYNSLKAHFNMDVDGFQDENKIYEQNLRRINSIKNKKVINSSKKNIKIEKINDSQNNNNIELNSYNCNTKNIFYSNNNYNHNYRKIKRCDIQKNLAKNNNTILSNSVIIKNKKLLYNFDNIEQNRNIRKNQTFCKTIYKNIINKINKYLDSFAEIMNNKKDKYKINVIYSNLNNINNNNNNKQLNKNMKDILSRDESFSFKNFNCNNPKFKNSEVNINKLKESKKNNEINIIKKNNNNNNNVKNINKNSQNNKKLSLNNTLKNGNFNHFNLNTIFKNQKLADKNRINIIINNNVNNSNNNIINKNDLENQSFLEYYKSIPNSQQNIINNNILNKKLSNNNNDYENDNKSCNFIKKIPINNRNKKENQNLIPHITRPIKKNYFLQNQTYDDIIDIKLDNNQYNNLDNINNMNKIMNLNNKIPNNTKRKLLEYTPLYYNTQNNYNLLINQQNNNMHNRIISNKNINENKMKIIPLDNKNQIKISPHHYNKNLMNNNYKKPFNENNIINRSKIHNKNFSNDLYSYNLTRQNNMQNPLEINNNQNKRIYMPFNGTIKYRKSSPTNSKNNNFSFILGNKNNNIKKMERNRSISNHRKQSFNFNFDYLDEQGNSKHIPKNINKLNSNVYLNNYIGPKCYNTKNI